MDNLEYRDTPVNDDLPAVSLRTIIDVLWLLRWLVGVIHAARRWWDDRRRRRHQLVAGAC
jgi:hypothetical protein